MSYRVELPVFCGPLDLLLHLVKQQEVDIHEIRIATILEQYLAHLEILEALDLSDLGDFLVLASTLMEIKSRELLPNEAVEIEDELDPRDDLIRRLLEYKRYRDVSRRLDRFAARRARIFDARLDLPQEISDLHRLQAENEELLDLGDIEVWTLTAAFARLLEETGTRNEQMAIGVDKRNMRYYADRILQKVRGQGDVGFEVLFDRSEGRYGLIGTFIAILEMMKQGVLKAGQGAGHNQIVVHYVGDPTLTAEQILSGGQRLDADDEEAALQAIHPGPARTAKPAAGAKPAASAGSAGVGPAEPARFDASVLERGATESGDEPRRS